MNGNRKINNNNFENKMIHPIFMTTFVSENDSKPIIPIMKENKIFMQINKDKVKMKQIAKYAEKPYTSINSKLILDLKKITNLVDIENMLDNDKFKTDFEFRYYFNLFIRFNLDKMSNIQLSLLEEFLLKYLKKTNQNLNFKKINQIIVNWKNHSNNNFEYKFIEYVENNIKK